jgi:hypothetical protein
MMDRRLWLLLAVVWLGMATNSRAAPAGGLGTAPRTAAQPGSHPSHRSIIKDIDPLTVEDLLNNRLQEAVESGKLNELKSLFENKDMLKKLTKDKLSDEQLRLLDANSDKIAELIRDPRFIALFEQSRAARKNGTALSDQQIEALKKLAESHLDPASLPGVLNLPGSQNDSAQTGNQTWPSALQRGNTRSDSPQADDATSDPISQGSWFERQMNRLTSSVMEGMNDPANAGAFEKALRSLGGIQSNADGSDRLDMAGLWKGASDDATSWVVSRWEWPGKLAESSASFYRNLKTTVPEVGGSVGGALSNIPVGPPSTSSSADGVATVAGVIGAVVLLVIGWQLLGKRAAAKRRELAVAPGSWPVAPDAVASRDDLVRAFEYLALLRLGADACTSNHLAVAARIGEAEPEHSRRAAAKELARLYERARYDPDRSPLGDADLAAARRDLSLLARVAAA